MNTGILYGIAANVVLALGFFILSQTVAIPSSQKLYIGLMSVGILSALLIRPSGFMESITWPAFGLIVLGSLVAFFFGELLFIKSIDVSGASVAAITSLTYPVFALLLDGVVSHKWPIGMEWVGIGLMFAGALVLVSSHSAGQS